MPLFSEFGAGLVAGEDDVSDGVVLDGGMVDDEEFGVDGGVLGDVDIELDGGVAGLIVDDEDGDDGDGVTTGGVVEVVVDGSRLQPATPIAIPAHTTVINARFIAISRS